MAGEGRIRIGTSGWSYQHWVGPFYPEGTRSRDFLRLYAEHFDTAELNNTFYNLPKVETLESWRDQTPEDFLFACKGSRYITHMKKLKDPAESTSRFFDALSHLGDKLGPILFQLPPRWGLDTERLEHFLQGLPDGHSYCFEFRNEEWWSDPVYRTLEAHDAAFCVHDLGGLKSPLEATASFVYVRLHGPEGPYQGSYDHATLTDWARQLVEWSRAGRDVYCYFDNDEHGYAARDAARLRVFVRQANDQAW